MDFKVFRGLVQKRFNEMCENGVLFELNGDKDVFYNLYLDSFPAGMNPIYRERREFDCSCCRQFLRTVGLIAIIKENKMESLWDFEINDSKYGPVVKALSEYAHSLEIEDLWVTPFNKVGTEYNFETDNEGNVKRWDHFLVVVPHTFVKRDDQIPTYLGNYRDTKNVFKRSLDEITKESIEIVLELIEQNSLYRGDESKAILQKFLEYKNYYETLSDEEKDLYTWKEANQAGMSIGRIRNHAIGTLLVNISEDMDLDTAVTKYEQIMAPTNYKRPTAIFTKKMLEDAKKTVEELGYMNSLQRRFATLDDITVNNILFSNRDAAKRIQGGNDLFGEMEKEVAINPKKFSKVEEISADDFINNVLPSARELELFLENKHSENFVSMIAPKDPTAKTMFKWNNGFSWAYTGNLADSMKERVKAKGGKVDGVLRFSIQWNESGRDDMDFDAHCIDANDTEIYFRNKRSYSTKGELDVDIIHPIEQTVDGVAVENITWANLSDMKDGNYRFFVHNYSSRGSKDGFRAEIEFNGEVYSFDYNKPTKYDEVVVVADVTLENGKFSIDEEIPSGEGKVYSKEIWGLNTNQFVPVSVVCYSPNYFDEQEGIGHKHLFFMLKNCVNPDPIRGFFNEYLKPELEKHKRVFEALGDKASVEVVDDQLSGVGFSMTKRADVLVKVIGSSERIVRVKF